MFERYTEHARRVIFFARYEASQFGKDCIEPEHLLLGVLRESATMKELLGACGPGVGWRRFRRNSRIQERHLSMSYTSIDRNTRNISKVPCINSGFFWDRTDPGEQFLAGPEPIRVKQLSGGGCHSPLGAGNEIP